MSGGQRFYLIAGIAAMLSGCSGLDGTSPATLPALPSLPSFQFPQQNTEQPDASQQAANGTPSVFSNAAPSPPETKELTPPEVNILAGAGPVKSAVLQSMLGLGYKVAQDNAYWTVMTKLSGSRLTTTRLTLTFGSIGTQTRVIADLRRVASGSTEAEPALDHPDRNIIQARLSAIKTQIESTPLANRPAAPVATTPPADLAPPQPLPAKSAPIPSLPAVTTAQPPAPAQAPSSPAQRASAPSAPASPSADQNTPSAPQPTPQTATAQNPAPAPVKPARSPLSDWLPELPQPTLPNLFPQPQTEASPDDRPLRKGQTRVRL